MLTLDEKTNCYTEGGINFPRVSTVIQEAGLVDTTWFTEFAADRGTYVHQACALWDQDNLDEEQLDPQIKPYLEAYKSFRSKVSVPWLSIEETKVDRVLGYAGTPDRVAKDLLVDLKTGSPLPFHGAQLAAYAMLSFPTVAAVKRFGLYLSNDGTYRYVPYKDRADYDVWRAALTIYHAKRRLK